MPATPLLFVGLGPIGRSTLAYALQRKGLRVVGACDAAPELVDKRLSELVAGGPKQVRVAPTLERVRELPKGTVAIVCTSSSLKQAGPLLRELVERGLHVVSSCEELVFPFHRSARMAKELDSAAKRRKVAILGTGVNPGFVLDLLPALLTGACLHVSAVRARRVVDASLRRGPLQRKIGAGRSLAQFDVDAKAGNLGHVGLPESAQLLCTALRFGKPVIEEHLKPVVALRAVETPFVRVEPGQVAGIDHRLVAKAPRGRVELHLQMFLGAEEARDEIELDGEPALRVRIDGGTPGDVATVAALLNAAPGMAACAPGLRTVLDGPFPLCRALA